MSRDMSREAMLAVIDRMIAAGNRQDVDAWAGVYSLDATNHGHPAGREGLRAIFQSLVVAFPDWHYDLGRVVVEGDVVMAEITMTGTHLGTPELPVLGGLLVGVPPTGRRVVVPHAHTYRIVDGYIVEHHAVRDDLGMLQQLGLLPATDHAAGDISRPALGA
ncbi:MAG TPA: ester cyclase [Chloroflexota bacterium]|nr:ester cyclase [Chloroflexota bacterium]